MRNFVRLIALLLVPLLAFAARPTAAHASGNAPQNVNAVLNGTTFTVTWSAVSSAQSYMVRVNCYDSLDYVPRLWYRDFVVTDTNFSYTPDISNYYTFNVRAIFGTSNSSWSPATSKIYVDVPVTPVPSPTPVGFVPNYTPQPQPTPIVHSSLVPYGVSYNYYTMYNFPSSISNYWGFRRGNENLSQSRPAPIPSSFIGPNLSFPVFFNASNSLVDNPGNYGGTPYVSARQCIDLYFQFNPRDYDTDFGFTVDLSLFQVLQVLPDIGIPSLSGPVFTSINVYNDNINDFSYSSPAYSSYYTFNLSDFVQPLSFTAPLRSQDLLVRFTFQISSSDYLIPTEYTTGTTTYIPYYVNCKSFSVSLEQSEVVVTPSPQDRIGSDFEHTTYDAMNTIGGYFFNYAQFIRSLFSGLISSLFDWFTSLARTIVSAASNIVSSIVEWGENIVNEIVEFFNNLVDFMDRLFIPRVEDLRTFVADLTQRVTPEDGSTMGLPHQIELEIFETLSADYSAEPDPIVLPEFQMDIKGESYIVFPRTELRMSQIFPPEFHRYMRAFGDLGLGAAAIFFLRQKVRLLLDLKYSEGDGKE